MIVHYFNPDRLSLNSFQKPNYSYLFQYVRRLRNPVMIPIKTVFSRSKMQGRNIPTV